MVTVRKLKNMKQLLNSSDLNSHHQEKKLETPKRKTHTQVRWFRVFREFEMFKDMTLIMLGMSGSFFTFLWARWVNISPQHALRQLMQRNCFGHRETEFNLPVSCHPFRVGLHFLGKSLSGGRASVTFAVFGTAGLWPALAICCNLAT